METIKRGKGARMKTSVATVSAGVAVLLLLLGAMALPVSAAPVPVTACGTLLANNSYILTADLFAAAGNCLVIGGNGTSVDLNGHSIRGVPGSGKGIVSTGNNITIKGPGTVHDWDSGCIDIFNGQTTPGGGLDGGRFALVENVLVYNCAGLGIRLGSFSKCVECRVHDVRASETNGVGISIGVGRNSVLGAGTNNAGGCLLESSIVERSDIGVQVGSDCKVWDLVVSFVALTGLKVDRGTTVARTVISEYHDGPGLDYTDCTLGPLGEARGCQDSSNSVTLSTGGGVSIADAGASVVTDCATNGFAGVGAGIKYIPTFPLAQCFPYSGTTAQGSLLVPFVTGP